MHADATCNDEANRLPRADSPDEYLQNWSALSAAGYFVKDDLLWWLTGDPISDFKGGHLC